MVDKENIVNEEEQVDAAPKDPGKEWEEYVRSEVSALLDIFLPVASYGNVGIKYVKPTLNQFEGGEGGSQEDPTKAVGVRIGIIFRFDEPIPIGQEEEDE